MKFNIIKCHGSGNDFVLIDEYHNDVNISDAQRTQLAIFLSRRTGGIGSDGVIFVSRSKKADLMSRIFNADGSEAELCGNGIRCVARFAYEEHKKNELSIETIKSVYKVRKEQDLYNGVQTFSVDIDTVYLDTKDIPINTPKKNLINETIDGFFENINFFAIGLTNPHLIAFVPQIDSKLLEKIGKAANSNKDIFPQGANVSFCRRLLDDSLEVETYERGVGFTYSCGTAMSASTLALCLLDPLYYSKFISVYNRGGMVKCKAQKMHDQISITLLGNATFVFSSEVEYDFNQTSLKQFDGIADTDEISSYGNFVDYSITTLEKLQN